MPLWATQAGLLVLLGGWTCASAMVLRGGSGTESGFSPASSQEVMGQARSQSQALSAVEWTLHNQLLQALAEETEAEELESSGDSPEIWGYTPPGVAIPELELGELEPSPTELIPLEDSISMMTGSTLSAEFKRCAIVGSSSSLASERLGEEIDSHDTVVRINRLPPSDFWAYVGSKTTILFTGEISHHHERFTASGFETQRLNAPGREAMVQCPFNATTPLCSFQDLVFNSGLLRIGRRWRDVFPIQLPGWAPNSSTYNIAHQSTKMMGAVRMLEKYIFEYDYDASSDPPRGTSGLNALFTFAPLCEEVDMYGFGGGDTVDGHGISGVHSLHKEHEFMRRLGNDPSCTWLDQDCSMANLSSRAKVAGCHMLRKAGCKLSEMARDGRLRFNGAGDSGLPGSHGGV